MADVEPADLVLRGGRIYTVDADQPWAAAVAIRNGQFIAVGTAADIEGFTGPATRVIELDGAMAMPGLVDAHVHPILGGVESLQCAFPPSASLADIRATLRACAERAPDALWITGGRWDSNLVERFAGETPRAWLDRVIPDRAVSLADDTGHNRWVNTRALAEAGLLAPGLQIEGGEIVRDGDGAPNGLLYEAAMLPVLEAVPPWTADQLRTAARAAFTTASAFGITGVMEAGDSNHGVTAYRALDTAGGLDVHLSVAIALTMDETGEGFDLDAFNRLRLASPGSRVKTDYAKIFLDGVPTSSRTAAMLHAYQHADEPGRQSRGELLVSPALLAQTITRLDAEGITVLVHTAGDRAVRVTLDAIAAARRANGDSGLRHQLAHAGLIDPADLPRFAELGAVADMSPSIWYPSPILDNIIAAVGPQAERYFPVRSLLDSGALVVAGSDWPAVIPDMNPWTGLEALVTRRNPHAAHPGILAPDEAISLAEALRIVTLNGAHTLQREHLTGSIAVGKSADLIVLDRNLFEIPAGDISDTRVTLTLFQGRIVHRAEPAEPH